MWGSSVQVQGSLESQNGWPQAQTNKTLVTTPFSARNPSMKIKPASQDLSMEFGIQPNGQAKKILLKKPADFPISMINLVDSPPYGLPDEDIMDMYAFGVGINSENVTDNNVVEDELPAVWNVNELHASPEAVLMSSQSSSSPMLMVNPKVVEGLSGDMTQDDTKPNEVYDQLNNFEPETADDQLPIGLNNSFDMSMGFDLLDAVMNESIGVNDPTFQSLVNTLNDIGTAAVNSSDKPEDLWESVDSEVSAQGTAAPATPVVAIEQPLQVVELVQEVKRGRGRPRIVKPLVPAVAK
jgi:hypothetical protein